MPALKILRIFVALGLCGVSIATTLDLVAQAYAQTLIHPVFLVLPFMTGLIAGGLLPR